MNMLLLFFSVHTCEFVCSWPEMHRCQFSYGQDEFRQMKLLWNFDFGILHIMNQAEVVWTTPWIDLKECALLAGKLRYAFLRIARVEKGDIYWRSGTEKTEDIQPLHAYTILTLKTVQYILIVVLSSWSTTDLVRFHSLKCSVRGNNTRWYSLALIELFLYSIPGLGYAHMQGRSKYKASLYIYWEEVALYRIPVCTLLLSQYIQFSKNQIATSSDFFCTLTKAIVIAIFKRLNDRIEKREHSLYNEFGISEDW